MFGSARWPGALKDFNRDPRVNVPWDREVWGSSRSTTCLGSPTRWHQPFPSAAFNGSPVIVSYIHRTHNLGRVAYKPQIYIVIRSPRLSCRRYCSFYGPPVPYSICEHVCHEIGLFLGEHLLPWLAGGALLPSLSITLRMALARRRSRRWGRCCRLLQGPVERRRELAAQGKGKVAVILVEAQTHVLSELNSFIHADLIEGPPALLGTWPGRASW